MTSHILVIDQNTTATRALVFDAAQNIVGDGRMELTQHHPSAGAGRAGTRGNLGDLPLGLQDRFAKAGITARDLAGISIASQR